MATKRYDTRRKANDLARGVEQVFDCPATVEQIGAQFFRVSCGAVSQAQMNATNHLLIRDHPIEDLTLEMVEAEVSRIRFQRLEQGDPRRRARPTRHDD